MRKTPLLLAAALLALAGASGPAVAADTPPPPSIGKEFPDFTLPDVKGRPVSLGDFRGKAILLSFWSCYTDTCFSTARILNDLIETYASKGLVAPTVCSEIPPTLRENDYAGLLARCGTGQIVLVDRNMRLAERLGVKTFPTTFLIDRNYVVWNIIEGVPPLMNEEFRSLVQSLVAEQ